MKVIQINATCGVGSTGKICVAVSKLLTKRGIENYIIYSSRHSDYPWGIKCAKKWYNKYQSLKSHIFGNYGFNSKFATRRIIFEIEKIQPDIVHLHNLHGHNCDLDMLFTYFHKRPSIRVFWTFHDCWAFTGYCTHYLMAKCSQWKKQCTKCSQYHDYSFFFDRCLDNYKKKKKLLSDLSMTIITPSAWLASEVKDSFLKDTPIKVINNGIDLKVFQPTPNNFREKFALHNKTIILGVAFVWEKRKGIDVFIELAKALDDSYQIILVGTSKEVEKKLPHNIISFRKTQNQRELAEIYASADVFFNPTREDNYPTVNMESIACGTPVITYDAGGSAEMVDTSCGIVLPVDCELSDVQRAIEHICAHLPQYRTGCLKKRQAFDEHACFDGYVKCYCE